MSVTEIVLNGVTYPLNGGSESGMPESFKQALHNIMEKVAYIDGDGQDYLDALDNAMWPPADLVSISAVYTQSGTVYDTDTLDSLKSDLVVTAHMSDSTTQTVTTYTLSGTLAEGTSTITVSYGGKTTTFTVVVSEDTAIYRLPQTTVFDGSNYIDTGVALFATDHDFTIAFDFMWDSDAPGLTCIFRCGEPRFVLQSKSENKWYMVYSTYGSKNFIVPYGVRAKVVITYNQGGSSVISYHVDGETVESISANYAILTTNNTLYIGANQGNGTQYNFHGTIYDFQIYDEVWDSTDVDEYLVFS